MTRAGLEGSRRMWVGAVWNVVGAEPVEAASPPREGTGSPAQGVPRARGPRTAHEPADEPAGTGPPLRAAGPGVLPEVAIHRQSERL